MQTQHSRTEHSALVRSPPDTVNDAHDFLEEVWTHHPEVTVAARMAIETALSELVTNVIQHNPRRDILCEVLVTVAPSEITLTTRDTGDPLPGPREATMPHDTAEHGRGLALVEMMVDTLSYAHDGEQNIWRVTKTPG